MPESRTGTGLHSIVPTQSQQAAIRALCRFDTWKVLTWLEVLRSLDDGYRPLPQSEFLTPQQIGALSTIRPCSDDDISTWLISVRSAGSCTIVLFIMLPKANMHV